MDDVTYKRCTKCSLDKPTTDYRSDKQKRDGLYSSCKDCCKNLERHRYNSNPEFRQKSIDYRYRNPEAVKRAEKRQRTVHKERIAARKKAYYDIVSKQARFQEKWRKYRMDNSAKIQAKQLEWRLNNADRHKLTVRNIVARRRAKIASGVGSPLFRSWVNSSKKICYWCGMACKSKFHVDHYMPLAKGGPHEISNLVISCPKCNLKKNAKDPFVFAREFGRLF